MPPTDEEFRAVREREITEYEKGKKVERNGVTGRFTLFYIPVGKVVDAHTGKERNAGQACLAWEFDKQGRCLDWGYKFNPFPLDDAVDLAFSGVERATGV
jgi:hypothetical protein